LNTSLAELTSSSEDESITWEASDGEKDDDKKNPFSDADETFIIQRKQPKDLEQTFGNYF